MRWILPLLTACVLLAAGCANSGHWRTAEESAMFGPASMRIHPIFTRVKDWTGDGKPDGIEALLEFQDRFSDPTKAMGSVIFELFEYRPGYPDDRGDSVCNPWIGSLATLEAQQQHWNRTSRTYSFQLAYGGIRLDRNYVLTAIFELNGGGRFFDRMIIEKQQTRKPATLPATSP